MTSMLYGRRKTKSVIPMPPGFFEAISLRMGLWMLYLGEKQEFKAYHNLNYVVTLCRNEPQQLIKIPDKLFNNFKTAYLQFMGLEPLLRLEQGVVCSKGHIYWKTWGTAKTKGLEVLGSIAAQIECLIQQRLKEENIPIQISSGMVGLVDAQESEEDET